MTAKKKKGISRRDFLRASAAGAAGVLAAACAPAAPQVVQVEKEVPIEKEVVKTVEVEKVVEKVVEKEKVITATAPPKKLDMIRVSHWQGGVLSQQSNAIQMFEEKTGITVIEEPTLPSTGAKLLTQFAAGVGPDVVMIDSYTNADFFKKDILLPLEDALEAHKVDPTRWYMDPLKENGYKGHIMGLSFFANQTMQLFVNKELAEEAGYPVEKLPVWGDEMGEASPEFDTWHWSDLLEFAHAGTKRKADGTIEQFGLDATWGGVANYWGAMRFLLYDWGGTEFDEGVWDYEEKECLINSPQCVEAVQYITDLITKEKVCPTKEAASGVEGGLYRARKNMAVFCWSTVDVFPETGFEQVYISCPWDNKRMLPLCGNFWSVNKASSNIESAIEWPIVTNVDWDIAHEIMSVSTVAPYDSREHVDAMPPGDFKNIYEIWVARYPSISKCPQCTENVEYYPRWLGSHSFYFQDLMAAALDSIVMGEKTAQQALDEVKAKYDAKLKES